MADLGLSEAHDHVYGSVSTRSKRRASVPVVGPQVGITADNHSHEHHVSYSSENKVSETGI